MSRRVGTQVRYVLWCWSGFEQDQHIAEDGGRFCGCRGLGDALGTHLGARRLLCRRGSLLCVGALLGAGLGKGRVIDGLGLYGWVCSLLICRILEEEVFRVVGLWSTGFSGEGWFSAQ